MSGKIFLLLWCLLFPAGLLLPQSLILKAVKPLKLKSKRMLNVAAAARPLPSMEQADLLLAGWDYQNEWGWGCNTELDFCEYNNSSTTAACVHRTQIYLSADPVIDTMDIKIGDAVTMGQIAPDYFQWGKTAFCVPALAKGLYYLGCIVDLDNKVCESDENNVFCIGTITVTDKLPDLIAVSLEIPGEDTWTVGSELSYSISEGNTGSAAAGEHKNQLCLIDMFDNIVPVAENAVCVTNPGETKQSSQTVKVPYLFDGVYTVGILIDSKDEVSECSEENIYQIPGFSITATGGKPALASPPNGLLNVSSQVQLEWIAFQNPDVNYLLQVSDDPAFNKITYNIPGIADPYFKIAGLKRNMKYYWRVAAKPQIGNYTPWSDVWSFSTDVPACSVFINIEGKGCGKLKVNGALQNFPYSASFYPEENITIEAVADSGSSFAGWTGDLISSLNPASIKMDKNWKISAYFKVALYSPVLKYPKNNSCCLPLSVDLSWSEVPNASRYHLQVALDSIFSAVIVDDSLIYVPEKRLEITLHKMKYFWRTRAENFGLYSRFSETWCFTTILEQIPAPDNLTAVLKENKVELSWYDKSENETEFKILRKSGDSLGLGAFGIIGSSGKDVTRFYDGDIVMDNTYTYRIYAANEDTVSAYSNQVEIKIPTLVEKERIPERFEVYQNYPIPFNSSTVICFDLPEPGMVRLSIVDLLGREISMLVNEEKKCGKHSVRLDAKNLTSGEYFYILHSGDYRIIKKLTVMK